jgi:hypothetical protein
MTDGEAINLYKIFTGSPDRDVITYQNESQIAKEWN